MPRPDVEAMAAEVVLIVKTALGPVLERLAATEARLSVLGDLRDRVVTVEAKAAMSPPPDPVLIDLGNQIKAVDNRTGFLIAEMTNRIAAAEDRAAVLVDLRDRVVTVEAKAAVPVLPLPPEAGIDDLRDRLVNLETKAAGPSLADMGVTELRMHESALVAKIFEVSERVAVVETRAPVAGPAGKDGVSGKDGADGLGFDDLDLVIDEARKGCFLRFTRGDDVKEFRLPTPFDIGPYRDGERYEKGNGVSWASSWWIAKDQTTDKPGEGATAWRLCVKKGRDGKDGSPGLDGKAGRDLTEKAAWPRS